MSRKCQEKVKEMWMMANKSHQIAKIICVCVRACACVCVCACACACGCVWVCMWIVFQKARIQHAMNAIRISCFILCTRPFPSASPEHIVFNCRYSWINGKTLQDVGQFEAAKDVLKKRRRSLRCRAGRLAWHGQASASAHEPSLRLEAETGVQHGPTVTGEVNCNGRRIRNCKADGAT